MQGESGQNFWGHIKGVWKEQEPSKKDLGLRKWRTPAKSVGGMWSAGN